MMDCSEISKLEGLVAVFFSFYPSRQINANLPGNNATTSAGTDNLNANSVSFINYQQRQLHFI